jgi:hypothetical protein
MNQKLIIAEIVKRYNAGGKESAKKYFIMNSLFLSEKTKKYFYEFFGLNNEIPKFAKEACDILGGKLYDKNENLIYQVNVPNPRRKTNI